MNMTTRLELRPIESLKPYENNARTHSPAQIKQLRKSLREFGFVSPVLITAAGDVIAGHGRIEAARAEGISEIPCVLVEHLTDDQRRAYILADNRLAEAAGWDEELVSSELLALRDAGIDIALTGFSPEDVLLTPTDEVFEDDPDLTFSVTSTAQPGQLWKLGSHRLLCGDATSSESVQTLTGGAQVDLLLTDPPYGISYDGGANKSKTRRKTAIANDNLAGSALIEFLTSTFSAAEKSLHPGASFYLFGPSGHELGAFFAAAAAAALPVHQTLVWLKNRASLSRTDYQPQDEVCLHGQIDALEIPERYSDHERILYGWRDGAAHLWCSDRKQTTVLEFDRPSKSVDHPTMKPIRLLAYLICNSTLPGAVVLDPFGGSGSTLIACEQTGRACRMMEIEPAYCDVIIRRWEALTGKKAVLL